VAGLNINVPNGSYLCQVGPVTANVTIIDTGSPDLPNQGIYSPARAFRLIGQGDGNFVLQYVDTSTLPYTSPTQNWSNEVLNANGAGVNWVTYWATNTAGNEIGESGPRNQLVMQADGNLVAYNIEGKPVFASNTPGNAGAFLRLQDDGNLTLTIQGGQIPWASNTSVGESTGAQAEGL
jgi:hypothetical protein